MALHGLDEADVHFLEVHEGRSHAIGGRLLHDLGDCIVLTSPRDREPFFNRVGSIRWPERSAAFDRRLAEVLAVFVGLDRRPHAWGSPAFGGPPDLERRLADFGFQDVGGAYVMVAVRETAGPEPPPGVTIERLAGGPGVSVAEARIREIASLLVDAFGVGQEETDAVAAETYAAFASPAFHVVVIREGRHAVAVGKRYSFDGASYLSSIGTDPLAQGRGYGALVTATLAADARLAGSRRIHLAVQHLNDRAIDVYRRCGFEIVGDRVADLLLVS